MQPPLISIVIPCYNQEMYLSECLQSVVQQSYTHWECLVIDDGSTDNSKNIALQWAEKDQRFKYYKKDNGGLSSARNLGLEKHSGDWVLFLDGDDIIYTEKLQQSMLHAENNTLVVTNFEMLSNEGLTYEPFSEITKYPIDLYHIVRKWDIDFNIPVHCILIKSDLVGDIRFKEGIKAKEDWIFWIDIFSKETTPSVKLINEKLVCYRQHATGISKNFKNVYIANKEANEYIYFKHGDFVKNALFERLNEQNFIVNNESFNRKTYIQQLKNTKILKYYLKLKMIFK